MMPTKWFATFAVLGTTKEVKSVVISDPRLRDFQIKDFSAVVDDARREHEEEGWELRCPEKGHLSQGQHVANSGTLRVTAVRYVPQEQPPC